MSAGLTVTIPTVRALMRALWAVLASSGEAESHPSCMGGGHTRRLGEEEGIMTRAGYYRAAIVAIVLLGILGLALPAAAKDLVPFKGYVNLEVTAFDIGLDHVTVTLSGVGEATHLGDFTLSETVTVQLDGTYTGSETWTADNGDQLFSTSTGQFAPWLPSLPTSVTGTYTFTGGTGRFANGTGWADMTTSINYPSLSQTFSGKITSPGANKK